MRSEAVSHNDIVALSKTSETRRIIRVMFTRWVVAVGVVIFLVMILLAIFAPLISPFDPDKPNLKITLEQPSKQHLFGTDSLGRDVLSRVIFGTRVSLIIGLGAVGTASILGMSLGLLAGYFGRWINAVIMRVIDAMMALPGLILALAISTAIGMGIKNIIIALGISMIPGYCRLMNGQVLSIKEGDFITAARSIGSNDFRIMMRHILPNSYAPLLIFATMNIGTIILAEAALSFIGIGITPPTAAWGAMVSDGYKYLFSNPVLSIAPGLFIVLMVLAFNLVGDGLRDALDPRLRGTL